MYEAVLLDVYGTLVHDDETWATDVTARIADLAGAEPEVVAQDWSDRIWAMADTAHGDGFRSLADLNLASLTETADHFQVRADVAVCNVASAHPLYADSLPFLAAAGVPVVLVSDADRDSLEALLDHHGITVDGIVTSEDARAYKPRPEPFQLALRQLGLTVADVIHVGDSPAADITGAAALGIDTAFVRRGDRRLPEGLTATHTVGTLTELLPLIS